ncbi:MAG: transcriptional repressor LexA [Candidatus Omnitrophica bacterium]|nr:transcriptional repressor LexA [Candidatus Omnitrophota bacterium]
MEELTNKQKKVLEFIQGQIYQNMPPTIREIAEHMGFSSTGTVRDYLSALEKKGYLKRTDNLSRSIELLKGKLNRIPIIASIPAGAPNLAYEDIEGYIEPDDLFDTKLIQEVFALRVKGESMSEAGIIDGDIAVIRRQAVASNGDVIAALLDDNEVTLKRLRHKDRVTYLEPANKDYTPIYKNFTIIGKLITILRKY